MHHGRYFASLVLVALVIALVPQFLIFPFIRQSAPALEIAYALLNWSGPLMVVPAAAGAYLAYLNWISSPSLSRRAVTVMASLLLIGALGFRGRRFAELVFQRMAERSYAAAEEADLEDATMVMGIQIGGQARAYPIRIVAIITLSGTRSKGCPTSSPIERSVTPVWCGSRRSTAEFCTFAWWG